MAESLEKLKKELVLRMVKNQQAFQNQKFGEFIIQSNNIQFYLSNLIILRASFPDKEFADKIESGTLGQIINLFCACAQRESGEAYLIPELRKHSKIRNRFAHKIHTPANLTKDELQKAVELGNKILKALIEIMNEEVKKRK